MVIEVEALLATDTRGHFTRGKIPRKEPGPKDVLIDIEFAGICHSDLHSVKGEWGGVNYYPMVPGHEIAGIVSAVGKDVKKFKVGDRAGVGCMVDSCRKCESCKNGDEQYCSNGFIGTYGSKLKEDYVKEHNFPADVTYGGYSQKITVDEDFVVSIPDALPLEAAAPLLCAGITTYSPLAYYGAKEGGKNFKTAIVGLGGLGDMGVKIAKAMGNEVTVISTSERKREYTEKTLGVNFINSGRTKESQAKMAEKHFGEFDLMLCTVSAQFDVVPYLNLVKTSGKFCIVGAPPEPLAVPAASIFFRRISIVGSLIGGIKETQEMLEFCAKHQLWPEAEHIKAEEVNRAYTELGNNTSEKQRYVIDVKDTLKEGDWKVDPKTLKEQHPHTVNPHLKVVGAPETTGKTYDPSKDIFA